jgi:hypothetical protein
LGDEADVRLLMLKLLLALLNEADDAEERDDMVEDVDDNDGEFDDLSMFLFLGPLLLALSSSLSTLLSFLFKLSI